MTGQGGWPMTVFLAPDGRPFFGGTYFPKDDRHGMPGFVPRARGGRRGVAQQARRPARAGGEAHERSSSARRSLGAPPATGRCRRPRCSTRAYDAVARAVRPALRRVRAGAEVPAGDDARLPAAQPRPQRGSRDARHGDDVARRDGRRRHVRPGRRRVPPLLGRRLLARPPLREDALRPGAAHRRVPARLPRDRRGRGTGASSRRRSGTCCATCATTTGGFFSAEDADSEGVEGKFYLWSLEEIEARRRRRRAPRSIRYFGVTAGGNFEDPHTGYRGNILHVVDRTEEPPEAVRRAVPTLFAAREQRVRPGLDDKVLLGWNALFLRSLAEAAAAFDRDDWMDAARANARFLLAELRRDDGRLLRSWQDGRRPPPRLRRGLRRACSRRCVTLAEVDDVAWLAEARVGRRRAARLFPDDERRRLLHHRRRRRAAHRAARRTYQDNATPAENSLAADGLLRLAALTGEAPLRGAGRGGARGCSAPVLGRAPDRVRVPARRARAARDAAARGRDRRRRASNGADALRREVLGGCCRRR